MVKKMPVVHSSASVFSTEGVLSGHGPSSNVSTTSLSRRKSSCLKCSKPNPGPPVVSISTTRAIPSALGFAQGIFAGAGAAAGKGAGAACRAAAPLVAGVCDHAVPDAHSETTPAKIKPAAMRIVFPLMLIASGPRLSPSPERFPAPADTSLVGPAPPRQRLLLPAVIFRSKVSIPGETPASGLRKRPPDGGHDSRIRWLDGRRERLGDVAVAPDQIFVKVPAWNIVRPCLRGPSVERMRVRTFDDNFGRDRKGNAILVLCGLGDFGCAARLLAAEIVGGNADHHQASVVKLAPQFLQSAILRRVTAQ